MKCRDILEPEETPSDITAENTFVDVLDEVLGVNWEQRKMDSYLILLDGTYFGTFALIKVSKRSQC